ncbi:MAG TPA: maleylpyruvate isomerase family mycothiol-dependent enzyme [Chloroflexia bacterium]|nr:maleylpyruvate isomerase family mycothiol-dependent enzyme [Chloroflexia bacterium]
MGSTQPLSASAERATAILKALRECRSDIDTLLSLLMPQDLALPTVCTGWSVRDEIGHIIDSTEMLARGLEQAAAGEHEGILRPKEMAKAMQTSAIERVALLPLPQLQSVFKEVADRLLGLLESRSPNSWEEEVPHPYLGTCTAVQFAGLALVDWFIHPWDIRTALQLRPQPNNTHAALLIPGLVGIMPKRLDASRARGMRGRFRYIVVRKVVEEEEVINTIDLVLAANSARVEGDVAEDVPADLTFRGQAGDLALAMLGRRGITPFVLPGPANETWLPRWGYLWISL